MNKHEIEVFGTKWEREIYDPNHPVFFMRVPFSIVKYTNANGEYCFITHDVLNSIPYKESFKWNIDDDKVVKLIIEKSQKHTPIFLCFNHEQRQRLATAIEGTEFSKWELVSACEIFT